MKKHTLLRAAFALLLGFVASLMVFGAAAPNAYADDERLRLGDVNSIFIYTPDGDLSNPCVIEPSDNGALGVTFQIDLSTNGSEHAQPGEIQIKIPASVFDMHAGKSCDITLPFPADGSGDWKYELSADGQSYILTNNIIIEPAHTQKIDIRYGVSHASDVVDMSNKPFTPEVTLTHNGTTTTKSPTPLNVEVNTRAEIGYVVKSTAGATSPFKGGYYEWNEEWGNECKPENDGDYYYVAYRIGVYNKRDNTQPYDVSIDDTPQNGGVICGYVTSNGGYFTDNNACDRAIGHTVLVKDAPIEHVETPSIFNSYWYTGVVVRYPKPAQLTLDGYTVGNSVVGKVTPSDGIDTPTTAEDDASFTFKALELNAPRGELYWHDKSKGESYGHYTVSHERKIGALDRLELGLPVENYPFTQAAYAFQYTKVLDSEGEVIDIKWGREFTAELIDDLLFFNSNPDCQLGVGDYAITRIRPNYGLQKYSPNSATSQYELQDLAYDQYPDLHAYGRTGDGEWIEIATFNVDDRGYIAVKEVKADFASVYGSNNTGGVAIDESANITAIKYVVTANEGVAEETSGSDGVIRICFNALRSTYSQTSDSCTMWVKLYPTDKVVTELVRQKEIGLEQSSADGEEVERLLNIDTFAVFTGLNSAQENAGQLADVSIPNEHDDQTLQKFIDIITAHDQDMFGNPRFISHAWDAIENTTFRKDSAAYKELKYENDTTNQRAILHYSAGGLKALLVENRVSAVEQELIDAGIFTPEKDGVFYDLLPEGAPLDPTSVKASGCDDEGVYEVSVRQITNYKGTGRTLAIFTVHTDSNNYKVGDLWKYGYKYGTGDTTVVRHLESGFKVDYDCYYDWDALADHGSNVVNYIAYETGASSIENGVADNPSDWVYMQFDGFEDVLTNLDENTIETGDPTTDQPRFLYAKESEDLVLVTQARYGLNKQITGPTVSGWTTGREETGPENQVGVPTAGQYRYRLRYASDNRTKTTNMILFDNLEGYTLSKMRTPGTTDAIDTDDNDTVITWMGTFDHIDVSQMESLGINPVVYYTTKDRDALSVDDRSRTQAELDAGLPPADARPNNDGSLPSCWIKMPEGGLDDATKAQVTGIAIDMRKDKNGNDYTLDESMSVSAIVYMNAPTDPLEVRDLCNAADDSAAEVPWAYNAINMYAQVKQAGGVLSTPHLITYEYVRVYLYTPKGNISIAKDVKGLPEDAKLEDYEFEMTAESELGVFEGNYWRIDTTTGYYFTTTDGVFVSMAGDAGPHYVKLNDESGAWEDYDPTSSSFVSSPVAATEDSYTYNTTNGKVKLHGNERVVLIDADADVEWTVTETAHADFEGTHTLNSNTGTGLVTNPFVIGDKNTSYVVFTNEAVTRLSVEKDVAAGDKDQLFDFTITITDAEGNEYTVPSADDPDTTTPMEFAYTGEAISGVDAPEAGTLKSGDTIQLKHGQKIVVSVPIGARYEVSEAQVTGYEEPEATNATGTTKLGEPSAAVFVNSTVPDERPEKKVEGAAHYDVSGLETPFTYTVSQKVSADAVKVTMTDTIEDVLEFVSAPDEVTVTDDSGAAVTATVSISGQTLTVTLGKDAAVAARNKTLTFTFKAQVKSGADLAPYAKTSEVLIPNTATVAFNNRDGISSEPVTVTPPTPEEEIEKKVNDKAHDDLSSAVAPFTYTIDFVVPKDATHVEVTDELEPVLQFVSSSDEVEVSYNGEQVEGSEVTITGNKLTVELDGDAAIAQRTRTLHISFQASIQDGADLSAYVVEEAIRIPNTARYVINNDAERSHDTTPVTVTPPEPEPGIEKRVNNVEHVDLKATNKTFTYSLYVYVPADANTVRIDDTLEKVLEFVSTPESVVLMTTDGNKVSGATVTIKGQKLTVDLSEDVVPGLRSKHLAVLFEARIKEGAKLNAYVKSGTTLVPNTASYTINNMASYSYKSNTVTVTPPTTTTTTPGKPPSLIPRTFDPSVAAGSWAAIGAGLVSAAAAARALRKERDDA